MAALITVGLHPRRARHAGDRPRHERRRLASLPADLPVVQAEQAIEHDVPGRPVDRQARRHRRAPRRPAGGARGARRPRGAGGRRRRRRSPIDVASDQRTAIVARPDVGRRRRQPARAPSTRCATTSRRPRRAGDARRPATPPARPTSPTRCSTATPIVIGFVLALAFGILLWAFRSPKLAAAGRRAQPAVGRRGVRRAWSRCSSTRGPRTCSASRSIGHDRVLAAAVLLRGPVRALDGLHGAGAGADPRGAPRRPERPRRPPRRASPRPPAR